MVVASLNETVHASVSYSGAQIAARSPELAKRVLNHFGQLNLAGRYAVAAAWHLQPEDLCAATAADRFAGLAAFVGNLMQLKN